MKQIITCSIRDLSVLLLLGSLSLFCVKASNEKWQASLPDDLLMTQVTMPGTHNSATSGSGGITGVYARCQSTNISQQLNAGVRALDIRCQHVNNELNIVHGSISMNLDFGEAIRDVCVSFLRDNPTEFIFMTLKPEGNESGNDQSFEETLKQYIAGYENFFYLEEGVSRVSDIRGKIVLFRRFSSSITPLGNRLNFEDNTTGTSWSSITARIQDRYNTGGVSFDANSKWNDVAALLNEAQSGSNTTLYINFTSGTATFSNPGMVANNMRPKIQSYLSNLSNNPPKRLGVLYLDFVGDAQSIVDLLIRQNPSIDGVPVFARNFPFETSTEGDPKWYVIRNKSIWYSALAQSVITTGDGVGAGCSSKKYTGSDRQLFRFERVAQRDSFKIISRADPTGCIRAGGSNPIIYGVNNNTSVTYWGLRKLESKDQYTIVSLNGGTLCTLHAQGDGALIPWNEKTNGSDTNVDSGSAWVFEPITSDPSSSLPTGYCTDFGNYQTISWPKRIREVTITNAITNVVVLNTAAGVGAPRYVDKTFGSKMKVKQGQSFSIKTKFDYTWWGVYYVFIDWNRSGIFEGVMDNNGETPLSVGGEVAIAKKHSSDSANTGDYNEQEFSVTVPANAQVGNTRIRLFNGYAIGAGACPWGVTLDQVTSVLDFTLEVLFAPMRTVTVATASAERGSVSIQGADGVSVTTNQDVVVAATSVEGSMYRFSHWTNSAGVTVSTQTPYTYTEDQGVALTAHFIERFTHTWNSQHNNQQNRFLNKATYTFQGVTSLLFDRGSLSEIPSDVNIANSGSAVVYHQTSAITLPQSATSFTLTSYATHRTLGTRNNEISWTRQAIFIDWNKDGNFTQNEQLLVDTTPNGQIDTHPYGSASGFGSSITLPTSLALGSYTMYVMYAEPQAYTTNWAMDMIQSGVIRNGNIFVFDLQVVSSETYRVTTKVNGRGGRLVIRSNDTSILCGESVDTHTEIIIIPIPEEGYEAHLVTVNGEVIPSERYVVTSDVDVTATFQAKIGANLDALVGGQPLIYPNPFTDGLVLSSIPLGSRVSLVNLAGVTVWQQVAEDSTLYPVTQNLAPGSYIIYVEEENTRSSYQVIKR